MRELGLPRAMIIPNPVDLAKFSPAPKDPALMARLELQPDRFNQRMAPGKSFARREIFSDVVGAMTRMLWPRRAKPAQKLVADDGRAAVVRRNLPT